MVWLNLELVNSARKDIVNLMKSEGIVFCGCVNDVSKNNAKMALKYIKMTLKTIVTLTSFYCMCHRDMI